MASSGGKRAGLRRRLGLLAPDVSALRESRDLRLVVLGNFVSGMGTQATLVALPYQIYVETHSALLVGLLGAVELVPLIASGIGVAAFFCFMFSWVELLLARTLTSVNAKPISAVMTRTVSAAGMDWGLLAAAGVLTIIPGALVIWFVRNYIARGFALGRV